MLLPAAWALLGLGRLAIITLPFRIIAPLLGRQDGLAPRTPIISASQQMCARQIGTAIKVASKYTPWKSNCFPQAIAARVLLGAFGIPYALYFGVARDSEAQAASFGLKAHAWVVSGPVNVSGGSSFAAFTAVACFVPGGHGG